MRTPSRDRKPTESPAIPRRVASRAEPAPIAPRRVERELRARLANGALLCCAGSARARPAQLLAQGYAPRFRIDLFDTTFYLSRPRQNEDLRFFVGYVAQLAPPGRREHIHARLFYKDVSLVWRCASHFARSARENWIGKGDVRTVAVGGELLEVSHESTTDLPLEVQDAFESLNSGARRVVYDTSAVARVLRRAPDDRIEAYADFTAPRRRARANPCNLVNSGERVAHFASAGDPSSLRFARGYEPDFRRGVLEETASHSSLYGGRLRRFRILSANREIQYLFVAGPSHVWIIPPQATTTGLSSFGVRTVDVAVDDDLCVPGWEYTADAGEALDGFDQIPNGYAGARNPRDPSRADASPWLDRLPVIREFRRAVLRESARARSEASRKLRAASRRRAKTIRPARSEASRPARSEPKASEDRTGLPSGDRGTAAAVESRRPRPVEVRRLTFLLALALAAPVDGASLLVADQENRAVLEFNAADGSFARVFAETIDDGFRNPGGIALHPTDGALFVSSRGTGEIWRYDTATGAVVVPAVATGLISPNGIDFAASGASLYFADAKDVNSESSDAVKRLDLSGGSVALIGSTAGAEFADVAVNGSFVFAVDGDGGRVVRFPIGGGSGTEVITGLTQPADLVFRSTTRVLVADTGTDRVLEYLSSGGSWVFDRAALAASSGVQDPCALAIAPSGALTVTGCVSNDVVRVDLVTLAVTPLVAAGAGGLASPKDAEWSGNTLLVASPIANAVLYFDQAGAPTGARAQGETTQLDAGFGLAADEARVAIASAAEDDVVEHDAETGLLLRTFGSVCGGLFPIDVVYGPGGDLFVACFGANSVSRIDAATGAVGSFVLGGSGGLFAPRSLAFGPNGNLFVSSASGEILEYDGATGEFVDAFVDASGNGAGAIDPYGFRFHAGALYVTSSFTDAVVVYDAASGAFLATLVASGGGGLDGPRALDFGPDGDLFVASFENDSVLRYDAATGAFVGAFVPPGAGGLLAPVDVAFRGLPEPAALPALAVGALLLAGLRRSRRTR